MTLGISLATLVGVLTVAGLVGCGGFAGVGAPSPLSTSRVHEADGTLLGLEAFVVLVAVTIDLLEYILVSMASLRCGSS